MQPQQPNRLNDITPTGSNQPAPAVPVVSAPANAIPDATRPASVFEPIQRPAFARTASTGPSSPVMAQVPLTPAVLPQPDNNFAKNTYVQEDPKRRLSFGQQVKWAVAVIAFVLTTTTGVMWVTRSTGQNNAGSQNNSAIQEQDLSNGDLIVDEASDFDLQLTGEALVVNGDIVTRGGLKFYNEEFVSSILQSNATAERTVTLPDASGTFCLDVNNCNFATAQQFTTLQTQVSAIEVPDTIVTGIEAGSNVVVTDLGNGVVRISSSATSGGGGGGTLTVSDGGTGATNFTVNGVLYGNGSGGLGATAAGTSGQCLVGNTGGAPSWATCSGIAGGATPGGLAGGDLAGTYPNPTIGKLQGTNLLISGPAGGHILVFNGSNNRWDNVAIGGDITISETGVASVAANSVALGTDTTGNYVAALGAGTGLTIGSNTGEGSNPTISVDYGSTANTAVEGDTALTCPSGTGNLTGGGTVVTLGAGGTCGSLDLVTNPSIAGTFTVTGLTTLNGGITLEAGDTLTMNGDAITDLTGTGLTVSGGALQSTLGSTVDLTSEVTGTLPVPNGGTGMTTFTQYGVIFGNNAGALGVTAAGVTNQCLVGNTGAAPSWIACNIISAGAEPGGAAGGDLGGTYPDPTIAKLQGTDLLINVPAAGHVLVYNSTNTRWDNVALSGDVTVSQTGVTTIGANTVALTTDTTGNYVATLGTLTGLSTSGNTGEGSTPTLSVTYGSTGNTSVQGNTSLTCPSGTGNLTGGGTSITLGTGGSCSSINTVASPSFTSLTLSTALGVASGGTGANTFTSGGVLFGDGTSAITASAVLTNGQLLIGDGTGAPTVATLTQGAGIIITNGAGSITVASSLGADVSLASEVTGTLPAASGGTGQSSYAVGDLLYASTTSALSRLAGVATGNALISGGVGTAPSWGKIGLTTHVSGTLPVANGGTNATTAQGAIDNIAGLTTNGDLLYHNGSNAVRLARGSNGQCLGSNASTILWGACGVNAVGAIDTQSASANGVVISGSTIYMQSATTTNPGLVNTSTQTFAGAKTFTGAAAFAASTNSATAFQIQNASGRTLLSADTASSTLTIGMQSATNNYFAAKVDYAANSTPQGVATGDFNADGKQDIALVSATSALLSIYINNGNGTFAAKVDYATATNPQQIVVADLNGDNRPDVAVTNNSSTSMSVFINNGNGTFAAKVDYTTGTSPQGITTGYFNSDNRPDIAVANNGSNTVSVFINNGNGTFAAKVDYASSTTPYELRAGDLNGDGRADLAVGHDSAATLSILINNGNGTFATKVDYTAPTTPRAVLMADVDYDGKLDVLVRGSATSTTNSLGVYIGNGNGTLKTRVNYRIFSYYNYHMTAADVTLDGKIDIIISDDAEVMANNGDGTFTTRSIPTPASGSGRYMGAADFNNDGKPDLVMSGLVGNTISVIMNSYSPTMLAVRDDRGSAILQVSTAGGTVNLASDSNTALFEARTLGSSRRGDGVTSADFNGDGKVDYAVMTISSQVGIYTGLGDGTFNNAVEYAMPASHNSQNVAAGDFNGDGKPDLATSNFSLGNTSVFINNGDGTLAASVEYATGNSPSRVMAADMSGDGIDDLVLTGASGTDLAVLISNGNGTFATVTNYSGGGNAFAGIGDFNNDGRNDVAVSSGSSVAVRLNTGSGGLGASTSYTPGTGSVNTVTAGDYNGDGKVDIAFTDGDGLLRILTNNGSASFTASGVYIIRNGEPAYVMFSADFNSDSKLDIAVGSYASNAASYVSIFINNGDGTFAARVDHLGAGDSLRGIAPGDFNGDNRLDIIAPGANNAGLFLNKTPASARLKVVAASTGVVGQIIQGVNGQTADLFKVLDSTGNSLFTISASGAVSSAALFKNLTDSTAALQIQNTSGTSLFTADTTNNQMKVTNLTGLDATGVAVVGSQVGIGEAWTVRSAAEANSWFSVAYGNGLFVALSTDGTNRVMTSPDGVTWTARAAVAANPWTAITYGNGLFVAVATSGTNRVMTSPDGITWTARTAAEANSWGAITYGNGQFVAVASTGTNRVMTSPDGITWTARTTPEANSWTSVTYGNGLFVAVSTDGTSRVMTSPDGITWTGRTAAEAKPWVSITYGNGMFVALSSDGANANLIMRSSDAITWTATAYSTASSSWAAITYGNGLFVAVANSGTNRVMTSAASSTNKQALTVRGAFASIGSLIVKTVRTDNKLAASWISRAVTESSTWYSVTYGNGLFVAVAQTGTNRLLTSPDGITWTARAAAASSSWSSVTYGNGLFVAVGGSGTNRVMTSPDGITWTARSAAAANTWFSVTYGNGLFVAVSTDGTSRVMTSPDGITWTSRTASEASGWYSITYGNGLYVAIAQFGTNRVMTSPDGITWTSRSAAEANTWNSVTYGNGLFVAVSGSSSTNRVMTSPDGITWTARATPETNTWRSVAYGNGQFVAVSADGTNRVMVSALEEDYRTALSVHEVSGNVGIGTANSTYRLSVNDLQSTAAISSMVNTSTLDNTGTGVLTLRLGTAATGTSSRFLQFYAGATSDSNGTGVGRIRLNNTGVAYETGGADFAEYFDVVEPVEPGDILAVTPTGNRKATPGMALLGIVSDTAAFVGNAKSEEPADNQAIVGLAGQVRTKITTENGPITMGDRLSISSVAGVAKKAGPGEATIGIALENYNQAGVSRIAVLLDKTVAEPDLQQAGIVLNGASASFADLNVGGLAQVANLTVSGNVTVAGMLTVHSAIITSNLKVGGHIITAGDTPVVHELAPGVQVEIDGNDTAGKIVVTVSGSGMAANKVTQVNFSSPFTASRQPRVVISAANKQTVQAGFYTEDATTSNSSFELFSAQDLQAGQTYILNYHVLE